MKETLTSPRLVTALFYAFLALLAWLVFLVFRPFLAPLAWAAVLVVVFYPLHRRLEKRWRKTRAALVSTAGVTLILIVPALVVMAAFVHQGLEALRGMELAGLAGKLGWGNRVWNWILAHVPGQTAVDLPEMARQEARRLASELAAGVGTVVRNVALFLFDLVVTIFALFYFFRDGETIMGGIRGILPLSPPYREQMLRQTKELIFAGVVSSLVGAAAHGLLGGITFALVGIHAAVFWGVVMAFFALLPIVGAWVIWGPAAGWLMFHGRVGAGVVLLIVCGLAVALIDNVLRPLMISGQARLSGLVVFISVLGGIEVFGLLGVVLGPIVVAAGLGVLEAHRKGQAIDQPAGGNSGAAENP
jgi:predicted PurR-regulated permease PerM